MTEGVLCVPPCVAETTQAGTKVHGLEGGVLKPTSNPLISMPIPRIREVTGEKQRGHSMAQGHLALVPGI